MTKELLMEDKERGVRYGKIMVEISYRIIHIEMGCDKIHPYISEEEMWRNNVIFESLYLQLRKICEAWAVAVLIVQDCDIGLISKMRKAYQADRIMRKLSTINSEFFPKPVDKVVPCESYFEAQVCHPFFTLEKFLSLYRHCGARMHAGDVGLYTSPDTITYSQPFIDRWAEDFRSLLTNHIVVYPDGERAIFTALLDGRHHVVCETSLFRYV